MSWFVTSLRENPELAIFLALAVGGLAPEVTRPEREGTRPSLS